MKISDIDVKTRLDLLDLPQKAADAVIWRNADQYADCFTVDAVWDPRPLGPSAIDGGRDKIREAFTQFWSGLDYALQGILSVRIIAFDGKEAKLRTYLMEYGRAKGSDQAPMGFGMYEDLCVIEDGQWRMRLHKLTPLYFGSSDWLNPMFLNCPPA
ncbi:MAG: hypothetical protein JWQ90_185 [Hydrocarboniphaga sp.]|uniref:nuclear transport factor 2 family protein n=1 Tax=Hydrocarboniphaga sp. TaxID=2033016 RepID=UPI00262717DA|nr:nuclear transport factor 2 family protein [Hydrocarboniphaga sp.]MDB5967735.1 hypothetical protein [Hydrocarboniphaga sp.]